MKWRVMLERNGELTEGHGRAILQLYKPTAGSVNFDGTELTTLGGEQMRRMRRTAEQNPLGLAVGGAAVGF